MATPPRATRRASPPPGRVPIEDRETDLPAPALFAGVLALVMESGVWMYAGWLWIRPDVTTHGQRYLIYVLGALADLALVPAAIAIVIGSIGVVRRGVRHRWRLRAGLAVVLGASVIGANVLRLWLTSRGGLGR